VNQLHFVNRQKKKIWLEEGQPRGLESESYRNYKQAKRDFTNAIRTAQRQYEPEQIEHLQELAEIDIGLFVRALKRRNKKSWTSHELRINGEIVRDTDTIRNVWYEHSQMSLCVVCPLIYPSKENSLDPGFHSLSL
jgi:hypothetical protein